jgi:hypothetical protein
MDYELGFSALLQQLGEKICKINKFSSFRQGGVTYETGYGVLHIDNASSDGDVSYSSDNVMIFILKLKKRELHICRKSALLFPQQSVKP